MERSLLSPRTALVLLLAILTGTGAGVLAALSGSVVAQGVLYGAAAFGAAVPFFNHLIAPDTPDAPDASAGRSTSDRTDEAEGRHG
ncbi:hypothetical protein [Streptomyces sp. NPDC050504]|uniref:hypothetical protein n=1 Tax=Streptomyces sp. NPDC050504 TaxID=3365618 RepID=UPI0037960239